MPKTKPANQGAKPGRDFLVSPSAQRVEADVPRLEVPRDEDDWRYAQSFDVDDEGAAAFYRTFGFVVFRGVLDEAETEASRQDILSYVQSICPDFRADDTATWTAWKSKVFGTPNVGDSSAIWRKQLVRNRHHPRVAAGFATALGCEAPSLLCNHDRWAFYRLGERTRRNVHLDINPWQHYAHEGARVRAAFAAADFRSHEALFKQNNCITRALGPHAQGTLALSDNQAEDAGFLCVPGSHAVFDEWVEALGPEPAHESGFRYDYADHSHLPKRAGRRAVTQNASPNKLVPVLRRHAPSPSALVPTAALSRLPTTTATGASKSPIFTLKTSHAASGDTLIQLQINLTTGFSKEVLAALKRLVNGYSVSPAKLIMDDVDDESMDMDELVFRPNPVERLELSNSDYVESAH
ncbi:hypothetical protein EMIHUDRAFT_214931 [Emiliania huxleyi CCMP1516]|uniref:Uncharacterized protein n=2 Tax=Emiliania huxleyi TaxID=2903 RepID=A0A0D3IIM7_EMIH1|nr:hypothetical protein EMIHUDRAFT_214931 [Emiliania huxleyi CCMP1516]EOD11112.1 hypothetical protein EMIHUDRAFT_214931 [Emiliania huxleyi CCMP1516]|eukprot:XP_005763541.1 hypothetical protein EMIHUDRAFT_214931 [Emiliania huxleyi CCMP1516]